MKPLSARTVRYEDVTLEVQQATVLQGIRRSRLKLNEIEALKAAGTPFDPGNDLHLMRVISYPDILGATTHVDGMPLPASFEEFLALPDELLVVWMDAVYSLNPHWLELQQPPEESEKKESTSSGGSPKRKRHPKQTSTR